MKNDEKNQCHDRPHPGPLPQERENCSPVLEQSRRGVCSEIAGARESRRMLFPLPGGEGQGEGERFVSSHPIIFHFAPPVFISRSSFSSRCFKDSISASLALAAC